MFFFVKKIVVKVFWKVVSYNEKILCEKLEFNFWLGQCLGRLLMFQCLYLENEGICLNDEWDPLYVLQNRIFTLLE